MHMKKTIELNEQEFDTHVLKVQGGSPRRLFTRPGADLAVCWPQS